MFLGLKTVYSDSTPLLYRLIPFVFFILERPSGVDLLRVKDSECEDLPGELSVLLHVVAEDIKYLRPLEHHRQVCWIVVEAMALRADRKLETTQTVSVTSKVIQYFLHYRLLAEA